jgi:hypothetical protein
LQLVSAASDLPDLWHRFLHPPETQPNQSLSLELAPEVFPFPFAKPGLGIASLDLFLLVASTTGYTPIRLRVTPPSGAASSVDLTSIPAQFGGLPHAIANYGTSSSKPPGTWTLLFDEADNPTATAAGVVITVNGHRRLNPAAIRDLFVAVRFRV